MDMYDLAEQHVADAADDELFEMACDEILALLPLDFN